MDKMYRKLQRDFLEDPRQDNFIRLRMYELTTKRISVFEVMYEDWFTPAYQMKSCCGDQGRVAPLIHRSARVAFHRWIKRNNHSLRSYKKPRQRAYRRWSKQTCQNMKTSGEYEATFDPPKDMTLTSWIF